MRGFLVGLSAPQAHLFLFQSLSFYQSEAAAFLSENEKFIKHSNIPPALQHFP
jgi:hypothetical protein